MRALILVGVLALTALGQKQDCGPDMENIPNGQGYSCAPKAIPPGTIMGNIGSRSARATAITVDQLAIMGVGASYSVDGTTMYLDNKTLSANTAVLSSRQTAAQGIDTTCVIASGSSSAYVGAMRGNAYTAGYSDGMRVLVEVDTATAGSAITLDCGSGAKAVYQNDGISNPTTSQWAAGQQVLVTYGGALNSAAGGWRILSGGGGSSVKTNPNEVWVASAYNNASGCTPINWNTQAGYTHGGALGPCVTRWVSGNASTYFVEIPQNWIGSLTVVAVLSLFPGTNGQGYFATNYKTACYTAPATFFSGNPAYNTATQVAHTFTGAQYQTGVIDIVTPSVAGCSASTGSTKNYMVIEIDRDASSTAPDGTDFAGAFISLPYTM